MTWLAGETITAARLNQQTNTAALTDDTPSAINTWEDWGTETLTFSDPGVPVDVLMWLTGRVINTVDAASTAEARISISYDGGSTFSPGTGTGIINTGTGAGNAIRNSLSTARRSDGTPTGDVVVKAELRAGDTSVDYSSGILVAHVIPK